MPHSEYMMAHMVLIRQGMPRS